MPLVQPAHVRCGPPVRLRQTVVFHNLCSWLDWHHLLIVFPITAPAFRAACLCLRKIELGSTGADPAAHTGRIAVADGISGHIARDYCAGSDHGISADTNAAHDGGV